MFSHYCTDWQVAVRREETPAMCYQKADKKNTASKDNVNNSGFKKDPKIGFLIMFWGKKLIHIC